MKRHFPNAGLVSRNSPGKQVTRLAVTASAVGVSALAVWDMTQKKHSILRNYPVAGHARFLLESIRPEIQQYFIERNWDGRPFSRDTRTTIYERARGVQSEHAFGTEHDVGRSGYEALVHTNVPLPNPVSPPRVRIGAEECTQPYDISLLNVSAMSFGSLSHNAIRALNKGAAMGGFAHDTGEGSISRYHREFGGDLVWASSNDLYTQFEYAEDPQRIVIDLTTSHLWDASTIAALDSVEDKYRHYGKNVEVIGLNEASQNMRNRMSGKLGAGH